MTSLFLAPHNDDETLFGAFTLLRYRPHVIVCLQSHRMEQATYPAPRVSRETRERETEDAMAILGCTWQQWLAPDSAPDWVAIKTTLRYYEEDHAPERVFAPAIEEGGNEQHDRIGQVALEVFGPERVIHYLTYTNGRTRSRGREALFERHWPVLKLRALACYESQIAHPSTGHHFIDNGLREWYAE